MVVEYIRRNTLFRSLIYKSLTKRAKDIICLFKPSLKQGDRLLDIGAGTCTINELLRDNFSITSIDVKNLSFVKKIKPILYDGKKIPFEADTFDVALLLSVLHHTPYPKELLLEAKRVSRTIILYEDIYSNRIHKYLSFFFDSLFNLEFKGHPHSNKSDGEWKDTFKNMGLKLTDAKYSSSFLVFRNATYFLEKH